tara:strand:- start:526 stop:1449 length:924 start_codon:yes stop_codon:yes gene_type:complete
MAKLWDENSNDADGTITVDQTLLDGGQVLSAGKIVFFGGELIMVEAPIGYPTGLTVDAAAGGDIIANWGYGGTITTLDWLEMTICDSQNNCVTTQENTSTKNSHLMDGQTSTTHGETYTFTLSVCNPSGECNLTVAGPKSATADSMVDGNPTATEMSVKNNADGKSWTVTWTVSGDDSDVEIWKVCYDFGQAWDSPGEMPQTCVESTSGTSADIGVGTAKATYHFAAVPCDDLGNCNTALSGTDIVNTPEIADTDEEKKEIGEETEGEIPTGAWAAIIGLVVVAFVVGAFILSRGGDGDEDDKDWDY